MPYFIARKSITHRINANHSNREITRLIQNSFPKIGGMLKVAIEKLSGGGLPTGSGNPLQHHEKDKDVAYGCCPRCGTELEVVNE